MPTAFITGISGQDGAYLAHLLLAKGYRVVGGVRDIASAIEYSNLQALGVARDIEFLPFSLSDSSSMCRGLERCAPDEIYNLAAQSSVGASWAQPVETGEITGLGAVRLFQAARERCPQARIFQASSSEMFGRAGGIVDENTPFFPLNPYGSAKLYAHSMAVNFREALGMKISCGLLFNHESPLRHEQFVTRKITLAVARIKQGLQDSLSLGNLDAVRDWGFAGDFARAMWLMLQNEPDDFVLATGTPRPLRDFVEQSFRCAGLEASEFVRIDSAFFRPSDMEPIGGDARKSSTRLGWKTETSFEQLVHLMVEADLRRVDGDAKSVRYFAN